jgi:hypothetical protein
MEKCNEMADVCLEERDAQPPPFADGDADHRLGTAAVLASGGFALYTYESLEEMTARDSGHVVVAHARGFEGDEDVPLQHGLADATALAAKFAALPEVRAVAPRVQFSGLISNGDKSARSSSAAAWYRRSTSACAGRK